jgi:hypothetical protein
VLLLLSSEQQFEMKNYKVISFYINLEYFKTSLFNLEMSPRFELPTFEDTLSALSIVLLLLACEQWLENKNYQNLFYLICLCSTYYYISRQCHYIFDLYTDSYLPARFYSLVQYLQVQEVYYT